MKGLTRLAARLARRVVAPWRRASLRPTVFCRVVAWTLMYALVGQTLTHGWSLPPPLTPDPGCNDGGGNLPGCQGDSCPQVGGTATGSSVSPEALSRTSASSWSLVQSSVPVSSNL